MTALPLKPFELTRFVDCQSHRRVRGLAVEVRPGRIVLRGRAESYHVKQLAQHELLRRLPVGMRLDNLIAVGRQMPTLEVWRATRPMRGFARPLVVSAV